MDKLVKLLLCPLGSICELKSTLLIGQICLSEREHEHRKKLNALCTIYSPTSRWQLFHSSAIKYAKHLWLQDRFSSNMQSTPWLARSDQGQITFPPQTNCFRICDQGETTSCVWCGCFGPHSSTITVFRSALRIVQKRENKPKSDTSGLNKADLKAPLKHIQYTLEDLQYVNMWSTHCGKITICMKDMKQNTSRVQAT